ncbi:protein DEK-like isoform X2 [Argopecten irradians]
METDGNIDGNDGKSDEPSPTKSESSTSAINESMSPTKKEEDGEEESDDDEPQLGLLERPVVIESGKRQKKKVERLDTSMSRSDEKKKKPIEFDGSGLKLGECPRIEFYIQKNHSEDMKGLYRFLFGVRSASSTAVKKHLRNFNGFNFEKDDKEYEKKMASLVRYTMAALKQICMILDLERKGTKEQIMERIMMFCLSPKDSGKKVPKPKRKRGQKAKKEKGVRQKRATKKEMEERRKNAKKTKDDDDDDVKDEDDDDDDDDENESGDNSDQEEGDKESEKSENEKESEEEKEEEEEEEEAPKKKKRKIETPKKKSPKENKPKKPAKKETKKPKVMPKKVAAPVVSDSDDSETDEPLEKKGKPTPPTNDDLKTVIKKILDKANLEEVTMKVVIKQVYEKYPNFDLSERKEFIKKTVRQLIT